MVVLEAVGLVSIHAPREGCDFSWAEWTPNTTLFQSTHPVRGATSQFPYGRFIPEFQSTHPVRGATLLPQTHAGILTVSIHAPREGCDDKGAEKPFASTVSIHAPREGCDFCTALGLANDNAFQSTHPVRGATVQATD